MHTNIDDATLSNNETDTPTDAAAFANKTRESIKKAIAIAKSQKKLAELCAVQQQTVSDWLRGKTNPSPKSAVRIEKATDGAVTRQEILPDFPWL